MSWDNVSEFEHSTDPRGFTRYEIFKYCRVASVANDGEEPPPREEPVEKGKPVFLHDPQSIVVVAVSVTGLQFRTKDILAQNSRVELTLSRNDNEDIVLTATIREARSVSALSDVIAYDCEFELQDSDGKKAICDWIMAARADFRRRGRRAA